MGLKRVLFDTSRHGQKACPAPDFDTSPEDAKLIVKIALRVVEIDQELDLLETEMDLTAVHLNGHPLRLEHMLAAKPFDLMHDIYGIRNCLDRETGKLTNCFLPRFTK